MTVSRDHDLKSGALRLKVEIPKVVQDINRGSSEFDNLHLMQFLCPAPFVDVAANRGKRSNCFEAAKDFGVAHISGMNEVVRSAQRLYCFGA